MAGRMVAWGGGGSGKTKYSKRGEKDVGCRGCGQVLRDMQCSAKKS